VSGQLHVPGSLPTGKKPPVPTEKEGGGPQSQSGSGAEEINLSSPCHETNPDRPYRSLITAVTELPFSSLPSNTEVKNAVRFIFTLHNNLKDAVLKHRKT